MRSQIEVKTAPSLVEVLFSNHERLCNRIELMILIHQKGSDILRWI